MKKTFLDTPLAAIALNFKVGSSSLSRAVIAAHHPELELMIHTPAGTGKGVAYPEGKTAEDTRWHGIVPKIDPFDRPETLLLVRDPIEKFRSACVEEGVADIDAKLTQLESGDFRGMHFLPQNRLLEGNVVKLYRFPQDLEAVAIAAGLSWPLPDIDGGNGEKPTLSETQIARVQDIYADDIVLFDSITEAGQAVTPPEPDPVDAVVPVPRSIYRHQLLVALARIDISEANVLAVINAIPDEQAKSEALLQWRNAPTFARDNALVATMASALGLTEAEADAVFVVASEI